MSETNDNLKPLPQDILVTSFLSKISARLGAALMFPGCAAGANHRRSAINTSARVRGGADFPNGAVSRISFTDDPEWSAFRDSVGNLMGARTNNCHVSITITKVANNRALARQIELTEIRNT